MAIIKLQIKKEQAVFFVLSASQTLFHDKVYNSSSVSDAVGTHCFWSPPAVCVHRGEALFDYGIFRLTNQLQEKREKKNILSCQTQVWLITLWTESSDKATLEKHGRLLDRGCQIQMLRAGGSDRRGSSRNENPVIMYTQNISGDSQWNSKVDGDFFY